MVRITVGTDLPERLARLQEPAELITREGRRLGHFFPDTPVIMTVPEARGMGLCPFTDEELEQAHSTAGEGRPLTEIWKDLGRA
jgi:hypothetical protein